MPAANVRNIIKYCKRPFDTCDKMDEELISRWNGVCNDDSTIYHLGDFSFHSELKTAAILSQLKGKITLIKGNHDEGYTKGTGIKSRSFRWRFEEIVDYKEIKLEGQKIVLFHYPIESWNNCHYGRWHLHGHSHGSIPEFGYRRDVGVDCIGYTPISFERLKEDFQGAKIVSRDYHQPRDSEGNAAA